LSKAVSDNTIVITRPNVEEESAIRETIGNIMHSFNLSKIRKLFREKGARGVGRIQIQLYDPVQQTTATHQARRMRNFHSGCMDRTESRRRTSRQVVRRSSGQRSD